MTPETTLLMAFMKDQASSDPVASAIPNSPMCAPLAFATAHIIVAM